MNQRNQSKFAIALLTAFTILSPSFSNACDRCDSKTNCKACSQCDDRGLLDIVDIMAGRVHASIKRAVPKVSVRCSCKIGRDSGCDSPTCGVEGPNCGVEMAPTCGVEGPSCGCEACGMEMTYGNSVENVKAYPEPLNSTPLPISPLPAPAPYIVPAPDSSIDPFMDESASRVRRIPARHIQYRKPANRYGQSYDPQAFNAYRVRLSDDIPAIPTSTIMRPGFETADSSRRQATAQASYSERDGHAAVVTASNESPLAVVPSSNARPLPRASVNTASVNPLRSNN